MTIRPTQTLVREYKNSREYAKEAEALAKDGWQPVTVVEKKAGVKWGLVILLLFLMILPGLLALAFARHTHLVVTYTRAVD